MEIVHFQSIACIKAYIPNIECVCVCVYCAIYFAYIIFGIDGCTRTILKAHSFAFSMCYADGALVAISMQKTIIFSAAITLYELNFGYKRPVYDLGDI